MAVVMALLDVTVGTLATSFLQLTYGNPGVGKSTLLRHIAIRELPIPPHITILFVEQEVRDYVFI